jgi:hypothetical protein
MLSHLGRGAQKPSVFFLQPLVAWGYASWVHSSTNWAKMGHKEHGNATEIVLQVHNQGSFVLKFDIKLMKKL